MRAGTLVHVAALVAALAVPVAAVAAQGSRGAVVERVRYASAAGAPHAATPAQGRAVTLALHEVPLRVVLAEIARQSGVELLYSEFVVPLERRVTVSVRAVPVEEVLRAVLQGTGVVVRRSTTGALMLVRDERAARPPVQPGAVRGRVTDAASGAPVAGATVALEGTAHVTTTDGAGAYRLAGIEAGDYVLSARRLGYVRRTERVTVAADRETMADIALDPAPGVLEQVVVTGSMIPTALKAIPTPITVVTDSQIAQQYLRRTDQIFRQYVPGVITWDLGLTAPAQNSIAARGASTLYVFNTPKIYIDGIESSNATFTIIDPSSIERVEIVRGPEAATLYGSDAMGGVMQVFTKRGAPGLTRPRVDASASVGTIESEFKDGGTVRQAYAFSIAGGSESAGYSLGGTYTHIGPWLPNYFLTTPSLYGGVRIATGGLTVDVSGRSYTQSLGFTNNPRLVAIGASNPTPLYEEAIYRQETWGATVQHATTSWWRNELTLGIDRFGQDDHSTRPRNTTPADTFLFVFQGDRRKASIRYNTSVRVPVTPSVVATATAGIDHWVLSEIGYVASGALNLSGTINSDPDNPAYPSRDVTRNTGYFGQLQVAVNDAVFATAGVRAESNTNFGEDIKTPVAPRVGVTYVRELGGATVKFRGSYGEAIRPPTPFQKEYSRTPYYIQLANLAIRPERQRGGDVGIDLIGGGRWSIGVTYYVQTADDLIQRVLQSAQSSPATFDFENLGRIQNSGLELEGTLHLSRADLSAHYAITNSTVKRLGDRYSGDLRPGDQVLGIPRQTGGVNAMIRPLHGTSLSVGVSYIGRWTNYDYMAFYQEDRGALRNYWMTYPSFVKANLAVTQRLTSQLSGFISMENAANSHAFEADNYMPVQGRITTIGLRASY